MLDQSILRFPTLIKVVDKKVCLYSMYVVVAVYIQAKLAQELLDRFS